MVIFGLDAGFTLPGYAFFDVAENKVLDVGYVSTMRTPKKERGKSSGRFYVSHDDARRVIEIFDVLHEKIQLYRPSIAAVELPIGSGRSSAAVKGMAYASAISAILTKLHNLEPIWVTPDQNKVAACGIHDASKEQVLEGVQRRFPGIDWPKLRLKSKSEKLDGPKCWAMADALSTIMYYESSY